MQTVAHIGHTLGGLSADGSAVRRLCEMLGAGSAGMDGNAWPLGAAPERAARLAIAIFTFGVGLGIVCCQLGQARGW